MADVLALDEVDDVFGDVGRGRSLAGNDSGTRQFVLRSIRRQPADDKFLKEIDGGRFANPDECVFEG